MSKLDVLHRIKQSSTHQYDIKFQSFVWTIHIRKICFLSLLNENIGQSCITYEKEGTRVMIHTKKNKDTEIALACTNQETNNSNQLKQCFPHSPQFLKKDRIKNPIRFRSNNMTLSAKYLVWLNISSCTTYIFIQQRDSVDIT